MAQTGPLQIRPSARAFNHAKKAIQAIVAAQVKARNMRALVSDLARRDARVGVADVPVILSVIP
jgi:hypothetical protein